MDQMANPPLQGAPEKLRLQVPSAALPVRRPVTSNIECLVSGSEPAIRNGGYRHRADSEMPSYNAAELGE